MRVLLLATAFNTLTQRAWCELRRTPHTVGVLLAGDAHEHDTLTARVQEAAPDLILCPYLTTRIPQSVWATWTTIVIHPGPPHDRGPSALDWAIRDAEPVWGVTALQAIEELDAGPVWAWRTFDMPAMPRKTALYNGPVADAALACIHEVLHQCAQPGFRPVPADQAPRPVPTAAPRRRMTQADRRIDWADPTNAILRRIRASDGHPGVRTRLAGVDVFVYDAVPGAVVPAAPGALVGHDHDAVQVGTGDGTIWIGKVRRADPPQAIKRPATEVLTQVPQCVPAAASGDHGPRYQPIRYRRGTDVGWLTVDFYNGAWSTGACQRVARTLAQIDLHRLQVLVITGGSDTFSNGIDLHTIEAAADPAAEAWANIRAINQVCRQIKTQRAATIAAFTGNAGAGGVMLALAADVVVARDGVILNPSYTAMGLHGSELHTFTLPRRIGEATAHQLLHDGYPLDAATAAAIGLVDEVGPHDHNAFMAWLAEFANTYAPRSPRTGRAPRTPHPEIPLEVYEIRELAEMSRDLYDNRHDFHGRRRAFVHRLPGHRRVPALPAR